MQKKLYFIVFLFFILLSSEYVYSLGITARREIDFTPGSINTYPFCVIPEKFIEIEMHSSGILKDYIKLSKSTDKIDKVTCYEYTVSLPNTLPPGDNDALVIVETVPEYGGGSFAIVTAVVHDFRVKVPYTGKYLSTELISDDINIDEIENFYINAENKGDQTIMFVTPKIDIFDNDNNLIASLDLDKISNIAPKERITINQSWNSTGYLIGKYNAVAHLNYDEFYA